MPIFGGIWSFRNHEIQTSTRPRYGGDRDGEWARPRVDGFRPSGGGAIVP